MADEFGRETGGLKNIFLEGEDAEHLVEDVGHLGNAAFIPGPDLWGDVVDDLGGWQGLVHGLGHAKVETRVVDQDEGVRLAGDDVRQDDLEFLLKPAVALEYLPDAHDGGVLHPVLDFSSAGLAHLRAAVSEALELGKLLDEGVNELGAMSVAAYFAGE